MAPGVKEQFVKDAGFQLYIVRRCGLNIGRVYIVYHGEDESDPFVPEDVTKEARKYAAGINSHIWELNRIKKQPEEYMIAPGPQCSEPYECWYCGYCRKLGEEKGEYHGT